PTDPTDPTDPVTAPVIAPIADVDVATNTTMLPIIVVVDNKDADVTVSGLPDGVTYDPTTGQISGKPTKAGDYTVTVTATVNGVSSTSEFHIVVKDPQQPLADANNPAYPSVDVAPGSEVKVPQTGDTVLPEGTKFSTTDSNASVDPATGELTVKVPEDATPGDTITIPVNVTYPDGSTEEVEVVVTVVEPAPADVTDYKPAYSEPVKVASGETGAAEVRYGSDDAPSGATYKIAADWAGQGGWNVSIDEATGKLTVIAPKAGTATPDDLELVVPVVVTYPDGAVADTIAATFTLDTSGDTPEAPDAPSWNDAKAPAGGAVKVPNVGGKVPAGANVDKTTGPG
ncbi:Rib/alpha-like domain-containing protein, partial [Corynebacterium minutissimum]|uniref:Rib/alpha-like domain-containing protein n=3 Tax=Corynebacterium minutissimum TaxID=38301 RepID=UPI001EF1F197